MSLLAVPRRLGAELLGLLKDLLGEIGVPPAVRAEGTERLDRPGAIAVRTAALRVPAAVVCHRLRLRDDEFVLDACDASPRILSSLLRKALIPGAIR
jgi:hypothetical protein